MLADQNLQILPNLPSLDLQETKEFYQKFLAFDQVSFEDDTTLVLKAGNLEIMFWLTEEPDYCQNSSIYIRGDGIDDLYPQLQQKPWGESPLAKLSELADRPWGMCEFYIHDPHGNLLRFGHPSHLPG
ncbi:bleomycin resistance protein [Polycladidibacter hongkongensis]|uniref:bleomycin resistance protein n=1 Tax=Polycladidibacter hongkongensis TaxID=1647556 RepID=UPI00082CABF8|nr:VOC family protein [Pseudovibrio hongkongensis]